MAKIVREITVCTDCMFVHANGETTGTPDREPWSLESGARAAMAGDIDDPEFSHNPCQACGTRLAGDRFEFVIFDR